LFPDSKHLDGFALVVSLASFFGLQRWKWNVVPVVLGCGLLGLLYHSLLPML
jgi:hypothetical protein